MKIISTAIEALEGRVAPAAVFVDATSLTASLSSGVLKIVPKVANSSVEVHATQLANGDFLIADAAGDADLELTADLTGTVSQLNIALGSGDDVIDVALLGDSGFKGGLIINSGAGDDTVTISDGLLKGPLNITATGAADIHVGTGALDIKGAVNISQLGGNFALGELAKVGSLTARGATDFLLAGSSFGAATLTGTATSGPVSFSIGAGSAPSLIKGALTVNGTAADDQVEFAKVVVNGALTVNLGAGTNSITADIGAIVHGTTRLLSGLGSTSITLGSLAGSGPSFDGAVTIAGTSTADVKVLSGHFHNTLAISGGAADDSLTIGSTTTAGPEISGRTTVGLAGATVANIASILSGHFHGGLIVSGNTANDTVTLGSSTSAPSVHGATVLSVGAGTNTVNVVSGSYFGGLVFAGGAGDDTLTIGSGSSSPSFFGRVTASLGAAVGTNSFTATSGTFAAGLTFNGGLNNDAVSITSAAVLEGDLIVNLGAGTNAANIDTFSNLNRFVYLGGAGVDTVTLAGNGAGYLVGVVILGDGIDSLTVAPTAGSFFLSFSADGGLQSDTSSIPAGVLADGFVLTNF